MAQVKTCPSGALSYYANNNDTAKEPISGPAIVDLEKDKTYAWCACHKSKNQPWCDGSHKKTKFVPKVFIAGEDQTAAMCLCKKTGTPPYCDGSHNK